MNLSAPPRHAPAGDVVPMVNVAFLLLIFFLVMARMAPPDPIDVSVPVAEGALAESSGVLFVGASGEIAFGELRGDAALTAAASVEGPLTLHADAGLGATDFTRLMSRLAEGGVESVRLSTVSP